MQPLEPSRALDPRPLDEVLVSVRPALFEAMRYYGISAEDGRDLLQDVLLSLVRKQVDGQPHSAGWLVVAFRHACRNHARARMRRFVHAVDATLLAEVAESAGETPYQQRLRGELRQAFGRLRDKCRTMLGLRYGLDCAPREAARRAGCSVESVDKITRRCLETLSRHLYAIGKRCHG